MTFDHEQEAAPSQAWRTAPGPLYPLALWGPKGGAVYQNGRSRLPKLKLSDGLVSPDRFRNFLAVEDLPSSGAVIGQRRHGTGGQITTAGARRLSAFLPTASFRISADGVAFHCCVPRVAVGSLWLKFINSRQTRSISAD